jgi:hypothetical protein
MADSRRVIDYSELWNAASTSSIAKSPQQNGSSHAKQKTFPSSTAKANMGWTADGIPQTASTARKLRKILTLIEAGDIESAESELSKLGPAKNNYEVQRALALAKTGGPSNDLGEEDEEYDEYDEEDEGDGINTEMNGAGFDWQGAMGSSGKDTGRQLTHAEIWDDSALVDAWNAAEEEYKLFHAQRTVHEKDGQQQQNGAKRGSGEGNDAGPPKKRSALWHDSPAKGSLVALAAKSAQEEKDRISAELAVRKKEAKALLAKVAGDKAPDEGQDQEGTAAASFRGSTAGKKLKGTTPPSSSISGNLAWHSACATVSRTPNAIGKEKEAIMTPIAQQPASIPSATPTTTIEGQDIFQNLAMAWYYAGYYQAMATKWSSENKSQ